MANPQPNIFVRYSKELMEAKMKTRISGVQNQVFESVLYATYGQFPTRKIAHLTNGDIRKMTGLSKVSVSKAKAELVAMSMLTEEITQIGNAKQKFVGIQKDYTLWEPLPKKVTLPKLVTNGTKIGNKSNPHHYIEKETPIVPKKTKKKKPEFKKSIVEIYEHYLSIVSPPKRHISKQTALNNIKKWEREFSPEDLKTAASNYNTVKNPDYIKGPSNFYGARGDSAGFFKDYLPDEFDPTYTVVPDNQHPQVVTPENVDEIAYGK